MDDLKLMEKCLGGNLDYFGEIYDRYIDKIYNFVYLKTTNKEVAEDIVSDVFMSALNNINSFRVEEGSSVKAWLYKIAYNKVIDFYRTNKENLDIGDYLEMSVNSDFAQDLDNKDKLKEVFGYLKTIKKEHRDILIYRIWDDLSYKEISEITGLSVDNCKKIVSRTLKVISANFLILIMILIIL
ncbi:MAG: RNA polymerase sigma factor [Candidatus Gracilibacteria bacterium]|nr:RNA polymerase sigma factor [Candidatus Gracilibacteria bacterium]